MSWIHRFVTPPAACRRSSFVIEPSRRPVERQRSRISRRMASAVGGTARAVSFASAMPSKNQSENVVDRPDPAGLVSAAGIASPFPRGALIRFSRPWAGDTRVRSESALFTAGFRAREASSRA
jgi:hypothetical protein